MSLVLVFFWLSREIKKQKSRSRETFTCFPFFLSFLPRMLSAASRLLLLRHASYHANATGTSISISNSSSGAAAAFRATSAAAALFRLFPIEIASPRRRPLSTQTSHDASPSLLRFHVNPGATLSVETPGPETTVEVTVGELHDAIEASWELTMAESELKSAAMSSASPSPSSPPVEARQVDDRVSLVAHANSGIRALRIKIPSRYCSLRARTNGGDLSVEAVREAALEASTLPGGSVSLGTVRATVAEIFTGRGSVVAKELVADSLSVSTEEGSGKNQSPASSSSSLSASASPSSSSSGCCGGSVSIERLVARRGSVSTGGGSLVVRSAFYGETLRLDSGGGELRLGGLTPRGATDGGGGGGGASSSGSPSPSAPAPPVALVRSRGGSLSIGALEGDADLDSGGGALSLHLLRGCSSGLGLGVRARSGGAPIRAALAPELLGPSGVTAGGGVVLLQSSTLSASPGGSLSSGGRMKDVCSAAAEADAALDSRWRRRRGGDGPPPLPLSSPPPPPPPLSPPSPFAPLTPSSAAAASTAGRRGGGDRVRDHGPALSPSTLVLIDARPGGEVTVEEESWTDAVERKARAAVEARKK